MDVVKGKHIPVDAGARLSPGDSAVMKASLQQDVLVGHLNHTGLEGNSTVTCIVSEWGSGSGSPTMQKAHEILIKEASGKAVCPSSPTQHEEMRDGLRGTFKEPLEKTST